jgi:CHAT domain-containing protein
MVIRFPTDSRGRFESSSFELRRRVLSAAIAAFAAFLPHIPLAQELTDADREQFANCRALQAEGKWREARVVAENLVRAFDDAPASQHRLAFTNELANLDQRLGFYLDAAARYRKCLELAASTAGAESVTVSQLQNNLAALHQVTGNFAEAERLNREALAMRERLEGKDSTATVPPMNNLAGLLWCIGDLDGAETLYRRSLAIRERELGPNALDTARSRANLGGLLFYQDKIDEAAPLVRDAAQVFSREAGPIHPETLEVMLFLGEIVRASGDPSKAREIYSDVLAGRREALGGSHVETAEAHRRLGDAERELGNYAAALDAYQRSDETYLATLSRDHPDRIEGLYGAGLAAFAAGDATAALATARQCSEVEFANLRAVLQFTDERQRLAYQNIFRSQHLFANLGAAEELAEFLLRRKGVVVDSLIAEARLMRRAESPEARAAVETLVGARARFRSSFLGGGTGEIDPEAAQAEVRKAHRNLLDLVNLSESPSDPTDFKLEQLQDSLKPGEVLIDFLPFERYLGEQEFVTRYGAVIVKRDSIAFIDCAEAAAVDERIRGVIPFFERFAHLGEKEAREILRSLHELIVEPLEPELAGAKTLFICPDGPLHFVPFACLIDRGGRFLVEDVDISHVSASREVIGSSSPGTGRTALLVGNPGFAVKREIDSDNPGGDHRGIRDAFGSASLAHIAESLTPLEGAQDEVTRLGAILAEGGLDPDLMIGAEATERELRERAKRPRILHLATHGAYLRPAAPDPGEVRTDFSLVPEEIAGFQNPLFGSWLALTGSRGTVESWARGEIPDPAIDGILMANEAAELDLEGTLLVVLSACDTATGEATRGDGVLGIRRGFRMAGAENVLTTLWPINDAMTVTIMRDFYEGLENLSPAASLSATQRKWLVKIRDEPDTVRLPSNDGGEISVGGFVWAINLAGPFLLGR